MATEWYMKDKIGELAIQEIFDKFKEKAWFISAQERALIHEVDSALRQFMADLVALRASRSDANTLDARQAILGALKSYCAGFGISDEMVEEIWYSYE